jgi:hypothetical protein
VEHLVGAIKPGLPGILLRVADDGQLHSVYDYTQCSRPDCD